MQDDKSEPSNAWLIGLRNTWQRHGLDADRLFERAELDIESSALLPPLLLSDKLSHLWSLAVEVSGDPGLGFKTAPAHPLGLLGMMAYVMLSSATMKDALRHLAEHVAIVLPTVDMRVEALPGQVRVVLHLTEGRLPTPSQRYDYAATVLLRTLERVGDQPLRPLRIDYPYSEPAEPEHHAQAYGGVLAYDAPEFAIVLDAQALAARVPTANAAIAGFCARLASNIEQARPGHLSARVRKVLADSLSKGEPRREQVAQALKMTPRALRRRLGDEGTHFQALLDATRRDLLQQYLATAGLSPKQICFDLGFSDPSNLYRACKRWFGRSLQDLRAELHQ
jgi:AraC-like DNA-binding protein